MSVLGLYLLLSCHDSYEAHYNMLSCITEHKKRIQRPYFEQNWKVLSAKCKAKLVSI